MLAKDDLVRLNTSGFNRFATLLGVEFVEIEPGRCVAAIDVHENLFHPGGIVHGGVAFSLADSSMALAIIAGLEAGENCSTIESKISYMKPVVEGRMESEAQVIRKGRRIVFVEAKVTSGEDLVATATATFAIIQPKASAGSS
jgi:acyl-CoA thioesterase